jgi:hypothetical protein
LTSGGTVERAKATIEDAPTRPKVGSKAVKALPAPAVKKSKKKAQNAEAIRFYDQYDHNGTTYKVGDDGEIHATTCP